MRRYHITDPARADLSDVFRTIAKSSPQAALRMSDRFTARFRELGQSPELGRLVEDLQPGLRRANEGVYAVFYRQIGRGIQILRVIHGMRDLPAQFEAD